MPVAMSFTVETDGRLPTGQPLAEAIEQVDAETDGAAAYFMVNCAHPTHFASVLETPGPWDRVLGIRANASEKSHAELDESEELDDGDPEDLARRYRADRRAATAPHRARRLLRHGSPARRVRRRRLARRRTGGGEEVGHAHLLGDERPEAGRVAAHVAATEIDAGGVRDHVGAPGRIGDEPQRLCGTVGPRERTALVVRFRFLG